MFSVYEGQYDVNSFSRFDIENIDKEDKDTQRNICVNNISKDSSSFEENFHHLEIEDFKNFKWLNSGGASLCRYPFKMEKYIGQIKIDLQLNALTGKVTFQIPAA